MTCRNHNAKVRLRHVNLPNRVLSFALEPCAAGTLACWVGAFENQKFAENNRQFPEAANEQNLNRLALQVTTGLPCGSQTSPQREPRLQNHPLSSIVRPIQHGAPLSLAGRDPGFGRTGCRLPQWVPPRSLPTPWIAPRALG